MAREEPLFFIADTINFGLGKTLTLEFKVPPINTSKHNQFMRDMERLQWFAIGHGYDQTPETWTGKFEPEEYNCVLRYLTKFGWAPAHPCQTCGTVVENCT
jgi:hypothetical protein